MLSFVLFSLFFVVFSLLLLPLEQATKIIATLKTAAITPKNFFIKVSPIKYNLKNGHKNTRNFCIAKQSLQNRPIFNICKSKNADLSLVDNYIQLDNLVFKSISVSFENI